MLKSLKSILLNIVDKIENSRHRHILLLLPAVVLLVCFMVIPLSSLFRISFHHSSPTLVYTPGFTFDHYIKVFTESWYITTFLRSVRFGLIIVVTTGILSYALAYTIWRSAGIKRFALTLCVLFSLFTTILIRLYGLSSLLGKTGPINKFLQYIHLIDKPLKLSYNVFGVVVGLTNECFPFFILILISVLEGIDWSYVEAAADLGASRTRAFFEVILPLSIRGLAIGSAVTFIWSIGAFATPTILGSPKEWTLASEAESQIMQVYNWPLGAALAFALLLITFIVIIFYFRLTMQEDKR